MRDKPCDCTATCIARVGYYYDAYVGDNGELLVVDGNNTVFSAAMNDNGTLSDYDGATWFDID